MNKPVSKVVIGNPAPKGSPTPEKSSGDSPVTLRLESLDSKIDLDLAGNLDVNISKDIFVKGKKLFSELEQSNIEISEKYVLSCLNLLLDVAKSITIRSGREIGISGNSVKFYADSTSGIYSPKIEFGEMSSEVLNSETDPEIYPNEEEVYQLNTQRDFVMTIRKFRNWWSKTVVPFANEYEDLRVKVNEVISTFNGHKHGGSVPVPSPDEQITSFSGNEAGKVQNIGTLLASKTTQTL